MQEHTNLPKPGDMPHQLPVGYFEALPQRLMRRLQPASGVSSLPEGYFDQLPNRLLQRIHAVASKDHDAATSDLLEQLPRSMPFAVPEGYFNQPVAAVPKKSLAPIRFLSKGIQWAAAACLIGLLGLSLWMGYQQGSSDATRMDMVDALADLPDDAFNQSIESREISLTNPFRVAVGLQDAAQSLSDFTEAELDNYLQQSGLDLMYSN